MIVKSEKKLEESREIRSMKDFQQSDKGGVVNVVNCDSAITPLSDC